MTTKLGYDARTALRAVQRAFYARLSGTLDVDVYDWVPEDVPYPYVVIGEATEMADNNHDSFGRELTITLHVWTRGHGGFDPALEIVDQIQQALDHRLDLGLTGHRLVTLRLDQTLTMRDPDPLIRHAPVRFRVQTEQLVAP